MESRVGKVCSFSRALGGVFLLERDPAIPEQVIIGPIVACLECRPDVHPQDIRRAADRLQLGQYSGDARLMLDMQHLMLYIAALLEQKMSWLSSIPYLVVHARDRATAAECIRQFDAFPEGSHHRVSALLFSSTSPIRPHVEAFIVACSILSQAGQLRVGRGSS